ncbi:hypothetical protein KCU83_g18, partial [Aureobasidium melanogenum]
LTHSSLADSVNCLGTFPRRQSTPLSAASLLVRVSYSTSAIFQSHGALLPPLLCPAILLSRPPQAQQEAFALLHPPSSHCCLLWSQTESYLLARLPDYVALHAAALLHDSRHAVGW